MHMGHRHACRQNTQNTLNTCLKVHKYPRIHTICSNLKKKKKQESERTDVSYSGTDTWGANKVLKVQVLGSKEYLKHTS